MRSGWCPLRGVAWEMRWNGSRRLSVSRYSALVPQIKRNILRRKLLAGASFKGPEVDKILLALLVTATGSLLLSAMRFARVIVPRRARQAPAREPISEVKEQIDHVPLAP